MSGHMFSLVLLLFTASFAFGVAPCSITVSGGANWGTIHYPYDGHKYYPPNSGCAYYVYGPVGATFYINMARVNIAEGDRLTISNLPGSVLVDYYGPRSDPFAGTLTSNTNAFMINLTSDATLEGLGFDLYWTWVNPMGGCPNGVTVVPTGNTITNVNGTGADWAAGQYSRYSTYRDCKWLLSAPSGQAVGLTWTYFSIYKADNVFVYDGSTTSAPRIVQLNGTSPMSSQDVPFPVSSTGQNMLVEFVSDGGVNYNGFNATWTAFTPSADCQATNVPAGTSGIISAPANYDGLSRYSAMSACTWSLAASGSNKRIRLTFTDVSLPESDTVCVYDGVDTSAPALLCVNFTLYPPSPATVFSTGADMFVSFVATGSFVPLIYHGFAATWAAVPYMPCDASNGLFSAVAAGGTINAPTGGGASNTGQTCGWRIQAAQGFQHVVTNIPSMVLQAGDTYTVYDGADATAPVIQSYTAGSVSGRTLSVASSTLYIQLSLMQAAPMAAFMIQYSATNISTQCIPYSAPGGSSGIISAPISFPGPTTMAGYSTCSWLLYAKNNVVRLDVASSFNLGTDDHLRIYNGDSVLDQLIADYADQYIPTVYSGGPCMLVVLETVATPGLGFTANWVKQIDNFCDWMSLTPLAATNTPQTMTYPIDPTNSGVMRYNNDALCYYRFTASPGYVVRIDWLFIDLEKNADVLTFYDGVDATAPVLYVATGRSAVRLSSSGTDLYMVWDSDYTNTYFGWSFNYTQVLAPVHCSGTVIQSGSGEFAEPAPYDASFRYVPNMNCIWNLTATPGQRVSIFFYALDTADASDTFTIFDGPSLSSPVLRSLWLNVPNLYPSFQYRFGSSGQHMVVQFKSNAVNQASGFYILWQSLPGPVPCSNTVTRQMTSLPALVAEPENDPNSFYYLPNDNCTWHVKPAVMHSQRLLVNFGFPWLFQNDTLKIFDGPGDNSPLIFELNPGLVGPPIYNYYAYSGEVFFRFETDSKNQHLGFYVTVSETNATGQCISETYLNGQTSGVIEEPIPYDGVALMQDMIDCKWFINLDAPYNQILLYIDAIFPNYVFVGMHYKDTVPSPYTFAVPTVAGKSYAFFTQQAYVEVNKNYDCCVTGVKMHWSAIQVNKCTSETQTGQSGSFASHTPADGVTVYLPNSNCAWTITTTAPNTQIRFYLDRLQLGSGGDIITVYSGLNASAPILWRSSVNTYVGGIVSNGLSLYVTFVSDAFPSGPNDLGFLARWEAGTAPLSCSGVVQGTGSGYIQNPVPWDGANQYATGAICNWLLTPATGYDGIALYFTYLQNDNNDPVTVYDGGTASAPVIGSWTTNPGLPRASAGPAMLVAFRSTHAAYGFNLNWTSVNIPPVCTAFNFPADPSNGVLAYPPPWGSGFRYQSGLDCLFILQAPPGQRMMVNMSFLSMHSVNDYVTFYDGYHTMEPVLGTFSGGFFNGLCTPMVSSAEYMAVRFVTGILSVPDFGFESVYRPTDASSSCPISGMLPVYDCEYEGQVVQPQPFSLTGQGSYSDHVCIWTLRANTGYAHLQITLDALKVGYNGRIELHDGNTTAAPTLPTLQVRGDVRTTTGKYVTILYDGRAGGYLRLNWTAVDATGEAQNYNCPMIPIPVPPVMTSSTTADAAAIVPGLSPTTIALISFFSIFGVICIVVVIVAVLYIRKKKKDREQYGDSTVRMDIGPDAVMKKRLNGILKQSSTKQIGKGGTAVVYKAQMEDGHWVAMKQLMDTSVAAKAEFHKEVTIFGRLSGKEHPNVLRLVLFCNDPPVIVCELAEKGSLHRMRKDFISMKDPEKKALLLQVTEGMRFLHENDIVHLDLKPENVLVGEGNVLKISDFGTSLILGQDVPVDGMGLSIVNAFNGTPQYSAPERFVHGRPVDLKRCDVFSFGILAWSVVTGDMPFESETGETVMNMHLANSFDAHKRLPIPDNCDEVIKDVIRRAVLVDFTVRPIFFDLVSCLRSDDLSAVPTVNYSVQVNQPRKFSTNTPLASITHNAVFDSGTSLGASSVTSSGTAIDSGNFNTFDSALGSGAAPRKPSNYDSDKPNPFKKPPASSPLAAGARPHAGSDAAPAPTSAAPAPATPPTAGSSPARPPRQSRAGSTNAATAPPATPDRKGSAPLPPQPATPPPAAPAGEAPTSPLNARRPSGKANPFAARKNAEREMTSVGSDSEFMSL